MRLALTTFCRRTQRRFPLFLGLAGALPALMGLPLPAGAEAARRSAQPAGDLLLTRPMALMAALLLAGLLAGALLLARAARRHMSQAEAGNAKLAAANRALQEEIQERTRIEGAMAVQQQEMEWGAQSLTQMNALLAEASGRFQELFQGLPVSCVCYDRQGRIMEWNRVFERLYSLENPLGRSVWETVYQCAAAPHIADAVAAVLEGETQEGIEWARPGPDKIWVHLYSSIFPLRGADGEITGAISADVDISAQHQAEEALRLSEERLHTLYNTTSQQGLSFEEKTEAMLALGSLQFGLEIGVLARVSGERYEVVQALAPHDAIAAGAAFPASETYCSEALALADAVSFEQSSGTERAETFPYQKFGLEAYIGAPIRVQGSIWGMLCFAGRQPHPRLFTSGDRELVRLMAQWVGGEIARQQAEEAVHESEERFRIAIASMSEGLILMDAEGCIRLWNDSAERILEKTQSEMRGWRPLNPDFTPVREDGSSFREGSYPLMVSLRRGLPQTDVVVGLPRAGGGMVWVSVNSKPLFSPGSDTPNSVVATFSDITERRRHEDVIQEQIMQIKDYTVVLETQKMELEAVNAELETLALRDGLTGLSNRRAFGQRLALEMGRAVRYGIPLSLLLLDVDHFKEYNDTFGHVAGDEVLKTLSQVLHLQGRETDFFARYGGEEFVIILPHTDSAGALTLAERLRLAVSEAPWPARPVTASIGAATLLPSMEAEDDLVSAADRALYSAKAAGRNRVVHALSPDEALPPVFSTHTVS